MGLAGKADRGVESPFSSQGSRMRSARRVAGVVTLRSLGKEEGEGVSAERTAVMGMPKGTKWERKVRKVIMNERIK